MDHKIPLSILATVPKDEQEEFKDVWTHSSRVKTAIRTVVEKKRREANKSKDDYTNVAWAYWAADRNGYDKAMREILELLP